MSVQARTSYLPNEILWGYRFVNVLNYSRKAGEYKVDYGSFNSLFKVETPTSSAKAQEVGLSVNCFAAFPMTSLFFCSRTSCLISFSVRRETKEP